MMAVSGLRQRAAMPLLDHFHSLIDPRIGWESFHHRWANAIADHLDDFLPSSFFARVEVHLGSEVATDVTEEEIVPRHESNGAGGVVVETYTPPATVLIPATFPDEAAIEVRSADPGARLLAVIELISPANKKSLDARRAFAIKSAAYLQHGIGLAIVDPVTDRHFNLHNEVAQMLSQSVDYGLTNQTTIYAASYKPLAKDERPTAIEAWTYPLTVGESLTTVPLYLRGNGCIPLDLEATYSETRRRIHF
jgi:hypothetical protein